MFEEQVGWAAEAGVDFVIAETFSHVGEALVALEVIKEAGLTAVITLTVHQSPHTRDGLALGEACRRLEDAGADVVGLNCCRGPATMLPLLGPDPRGGDGHVAALPVPYRTHDDQPTFQSLRDTDGGADGAMPFPTALDPFTCTRYEIAEFARERAEPRRRLPRPLLRRRAAPPPQPRGGARPHAAREPRTRRTCRSTRTSERDESLQAENRRVRRRTCSRREHGRDDAHDRRPPAPLARAADRGRSPAETQPAAAPRLGARARRASGESEIDLGAHDARRADRAARPQRDRRRRGLARSRRSASPSLPDDEEPRARSTRTRAGSSSSSQRRTAGSSPSPPASSTRRVRRRVRRRTRARRPRRARSEARRARAPRRVPLRPSRAPHSPPAGAPRWWAAVVDYTAQMQAAYAAWLAGGAERWPELRVVFAILAGGAPFQLERLRLERRVGRVTSCTSNVFFETSSYGRRAIELCLATFGVSQPRLRQRRAR